MYVCMYVCVCVCVCVCMYVCMYVCTYVCDLGRKMFGCGIINNRHYNYVVMHNNIFPGASAINDNIIIN